MTFNIALSGLSAASSDLNITGNNIANASTVGFKSSRAEFSDVYSASLFGSGSNQVGGGVKLANVAQQFDQGTISFTNNSLDLAIDGNGFFVLSDSGSRSYTRAGAFGVEEQGFLVSNSGARVQGFSANEEGTLSGILGDIQINTNNLAPARTTRINTQVNLDARVPVLSRVGSTLSTTGVAVSAPQAGLSAPTPSVLDASGAPTPFNYGINTTSDITAGDPIAAFDFSAAGSDTHASFEVSLSGSSIASENQTVSVTLDSNIATLQDLISDIRDDLVGTGIGVDVREDPNNLGQLQFYAVNTGEASTIQIDPNDNAVLGASVNRTDVEAALGGISLGQGGSGGSSNQNPDPYGGTNTTAQVGNISSGSFELTLTGSSGTNGTTRIILDSDIQNVDDLIVDIRDDLLATGLSVDVREDSQNPGQLQFYSTVPGEGSTISIGNLDASNIGVLQSNLINTLNLATGLSVPGLAAVNNGYVAQSVDVVYPDGSTQTVTTSAGDSAASIAAQFTKATVAGVSAIASTTGQIPAAGFNNGSSSMELSLNGVALSGITLVDIADEINSGIPGLGTVEALIDPAGNLQITDSVGNDLVFRVSGGQPTDSIEISGPNGGAVVLTSAGNSAAAIGGEVAFTFDEGIQLANPDPAVSNVFGLLDDSAYTQFVLNTFDPNNQETYNSATSMSVFDSLGNPHVLSMYYVKERVDSGLPGDAPNQWSVYALIDGKDIGDPDLNLAPPQNTDATRARFSLEFNDDGTINELGTDPILISNWVPVDGNGNSNGAVGPQNLLAGGGLPVADPPTSSNFEIRLGKSTQFGSEFAVSALDQDGYSTGELSGLDIDSEGIVQARYTNGLNQVLGQVAIADFTNMQGLSAVGNSAWTETTSSGAPVIAAPGAGALGLITSGALEESNVELSEQLVQLIVAQRNFQANARTITTSDEITQSIINI